MGQIYLFNCNYQSAIFCYEEALVSDQLNANISIRIAELYYTIGGMENLKKAELYYSMVIFR